MRIHLHNVVILFVISYLLLYIYIYVSKYLKDSSSLKYDNLMDFKYEVINVSSKPEDFKVIVFYNEDRRRKLLLEKLYGECEYKNCIFTRDRNRLAGADAVMFYIGTRNERMGKLPPIPPEQRNPNQIWMFKSYEAPASYYNTDYLSSPWLNTMNWSVMYLLNSDIVNPFGTLKTRTILPQRDYDKIYNKKTKNALWLVRQCQSQSARRQFINEMTDLGFEVDRLGSCGNDGLALSQEELENIIPKYKFYLAFEKVLCNDYITEKFFRNYNFNWILVVRGGADYHRLLPTDTYINTEDFPNISSLVNYLTDLGNNRQEYINFLKRKDRYESSLNTPADVNCEICRRLNNVSKFRKTYKTLESYDYYGQCKRALDLQ